MSRKTRVGWGVFGGCWLAALAGAALGELVLAPNPIAQFPFHHDDFEALTFSVARFGMPSVRPVSRFAMSVLADLGMTGYYTAIFAFVVLYLVLAVVLATRLLDAELSPVELVGTSFVVGVAFFLFEEASQTVRYTGIVTHLTSTIFGSAAALCALRAADRRLLPPVAACFFLMLSVYGKEDYVLLVLLAAAVAAFRAFRAGDPHGGRRALVLGVVLAAIGASAFAYARFVVHAPFTSGSGVYALSLAPGVLVRALALYFGLTRVAVAVLGGLVLVTLLALRSDRSLALGLAIVWLGLLGLILPYLPLVEHRYPWYAYNWLPLMIAAVAVAARVLIRDAMPARAWRVSVAAAVLAVGCLAVVGKSERERVAAELTLDQRRNRAIVVALAQHADVLRRYDVVVVEGVDGFRQPWMFGDGAFVDGVIGRDVLWVVVARPDSFIAWAYDAFGRERDNGAVRVVDAVPAPSADTVRVVFDADLHASVVMPVAGG